MAAGGSDTRDRWPVLWTAIQVNLGNALQALGERKGSIVLLVEAVAAYRSIVQYVNGDDQIQWAAHYNIGNAHIALSKLQSGSASLESAITAYQTALASHGIRSDTIKFIAVHHNLGNAFRMLGERMRSREALHQALHFYHAGLRAIRTVDAPVQRELFNRNIQRTHDSVRELQEQSKVSNLMQESG
ncbi:MAG: tetratricopeptide repeat protein [Gammaproteobacteria bacterium]|nr:tetratricopeptide repeat protein [Gammaproteobacteria bacterium]